MLKPPKKQVTFRLSETTIKELTDIAKKQGVSQADVITILVHLFNCGEELDTANDWFDVVRLS